MKKKDKVQRQGLGARYMTPLRTEEAKAEAVREARKLLKVRVDASKAFSLRETVATPFGNGKITDIDIRTGNIRVRLGSKVESFAADSVQKI